MNTASLTIPHHHTATENSGNKQKGGGSEGNEWDSQLSQGRWREERMNKWESRQSIAVGFKFSL